MKVLIATEKPFAKVAVDGIRQEIEGAGYELTLLEKYTEKAQLLEAVKDADAVIILTEWNQFRGLDLELLKKQMRGNLFADFRNIYDRSLVEQAGFAYIGVGR